MLRTLVSALEDYAGYDGPTQTALVNDLLGDCARACGLGTIAVVGPQEAVVNVRGRLREGAASPLPGIRLLRTAFHVHADALAVEDDGYAQLEAVLAQYEMDGDGAYVWILPDGYLAGLTEVETVWQAHGGGYFSHESICVLNTADRPTRCRLDVFYEDTSRESVSVEFRVEARQSLHYRLDKLQNEDGSPLIAKDAPASYRVTSYETRVVVQGSRILTSGRSSEFASFGTAIAWMPTS